MRVSKRVKQVIIIVFAVLAVGGMVVALMLTAQSRDGGEYQRGEVSVPSEVPNPTPSEWPSDWPATPAPTPEGVQGGEGTFLDPAAVDRSDPAAVAEAFAELSISWDTVMDDGTEAGLTRAMPFVAEDGDVVTGGGGVGAGWVNATGHQAYTVPSAQIVEFHAEGEEPPVYAPTGEIIEPFTLEATYKWQGRDGWVSSTSASRTVYLSLVERGGEWVVVEYGYVDPPLDAIAE